MTASVAGEALPRLMVSGLCHRFGANAVLSDLSFELAAGEILCVVGPSGCGKSTLLRLVAGLDPVQHGEVRIDGELVASPERHLPAEARRVGLVFQDFALFPHMSLRENVAFGLRNLPPARRRERALDLLARMDLADRAGAMPHELSGGQQQRVALARALAPEPRLLLLDEPFSNLDARLRQSVRAATRRILEERRTAAILVTHDPEEAMMIADRIALLCAGRLVQIGSPLDLYHRPVDAFAAELFGDVNRLTGVVRDGAVQTALGRVATAHIGNGTEVVVLVRPEAIVAVPQGGAGALASGPGAAFPAIPPGRDETVPARIVTTWPLGARMLVELEVPGAGGPTTVQASLPLAGHARAGTWLQVRLDPVGTFVFETT